MGIIQAAVSSAKDVANEQWKEFFYCDSIADEILLVRGVKRVSQHSANNRMDDEVITPGSVVCVADGQGALAVSQGKVIASYMEPGEHIYENPEQPGGVKGFFKETGNRIAFGGGVQTNTQRIYYFNTKEIRGTPFNARIPKTLTGMDLQSAVSIGGVFSYRVCDPAAFYKMVTGNVALRYERSRLNSQLVSELVTTLATAFAKTEIPAMSDIGLHVDDLVTTLKADVNEIWRQKRGLELVSVAFSGWDFEGATAVANVQMTKVFAAGNPADPATDRGTADSGASQQRTADSGSLQQQAAGNGSSDDERTSEGSSKTMSTSESSSSSWTCQCGHVCTTNFCPECGSKKPEGWICKCGHICTTNFCPECGSKKPEEWICECGQENKGNFCISCGRNRGVR
ncbi:MAG: SPFH domain-containing protein [Lachnospiraceae bacterium]|nr:SPFH domain-containing protein [Lachnospiraceae bacterium]